MTVAPESEAGVSSFESGNVFAEAHFYDGGLRNKVVSRDGERPAWAPKYDWVGFRDEVRLQNSDYVIEIVKFAQGESSLNWIAVYAHAPDAKYGDRNNHAGVGIWLRNQFPFRPVPIIDGLQKLLEAHRSKPAEVFETTAKRFLIGALDKWISEYGQLPAPLNGMPPATSPAYSTRGYYVADGENAGNLAADLVTRAFFYHPDDDDVSRMLIHVSTGGASSGFEAREKVDFGTDLVRILPTALSDQADRMRALTAERDQLTQDVASLDDQVEKLEAEKSALAADLGESKRQYEEFKLSIEENDELKRFATIHDGISHVQNSTNEIIREMSEMKRGIVDAVRSETQKALSARPVRPAGEYGSGGPHPSRKPPPPSPPQEQWDYLRIGIALGLGTIILVSVIYVIYWLYNYYI